jgi:hypothetical protein
MSVGGGRAECPTFSWGRGARRKRRYHRLTIVGAALGLDVGASVGAALGVDVGWIVGASVGAALGLDVGWIVGASVGAALGLDVGQGVGASVGSWPCEYGYKWSMAIAHTC